MNTVRSIVSKKKKRYVSADEGFDLDLSYITPRIIAMGFPSSGVEAAYRNPMPEVQRFFKSRHAGHYKIYNLCSERAYDITGYFDLVERCPFDDHNPCALKLVERFCQSVDAYLSEHPQNVVGIHCKAGKGRTGMMISAYLLHAGICTTAEDALSRFAHERTQNGKGVTIPSQIRWVHYYEQLLRREEVLSYTYRITHIRLVTVPNFDPAITGGGCDPYVIVKVLDQGMDGTWKEKTVFNMIKEIRRAQKYYPSDKYCDLDLTPFNLCVRGDVKLLFFDQDQYTSDDKMCHLWFNTAFVERNYLVFDKTVVDRACKDKNHRTFDQEFKIEIFLHRVEDEQFDVTQYAEEDHGDDLDEDDEDDK